MKKLIQGILDFRRHGKDAYCCRFGELADRHDPDALFVACCDSRVVPNVFASTDPGDLFVLRNIGNSIPPIGLSDASVTAAIEFALLELKVKDIIVCGHSDCGAMHAILKQKQLYPGVAAWLSCVKPSYERFLEERDIFAPDISPVNRLSQIHVLQQLEHLKMYPIVSERLQQGLLAIHGWWFDLGTADVFRYSEEEQKFVLIDGV